MIFTDVCSSFKGFKCVIQNLKDPKKYMEICHQLDKGLVDKNVH